MKTRPFDIKYRPQIESGEYKVVTRCGYEATILSWDVGVVYLPGLESERAYPTKDSILFCYTDISGEDLVHITDRDGHLGGPGWDSPYDLFVQIPTPEPEMAEFEKAVQNALMNARSVQYVDAIEDATSETAQRLLELAKKQLLESEELLTQEHHQALMNAIVKQCKEDLPKWKKAKCGTKFNGDTIIISEGETEARLVRCAVNDCVYIPISDLEKLPKEE